MDVVLVAAVAENGVIGSDGDLPWHVSADLKHFKRLTMGHPVIMGRVTYEGIADRLDGPLPGRTNIVLSRSGFATEDDVIVVDGIDAALTAAAGTGADTAYVIGGESVYTAVLDRPVADRLVISHIPGEYSGDSYWPGPDFSTLTELHRKEIGENVTVVTYSAPDG